MCRQLKNKIKSTKYNRLKRTKLRASKEYNIREYKRLLQSIPIVPFYTPYVPYESELTKSDDFLYTYLHGSLYSAIIPQKVSVIKHI